MTGNTFENNGHRGGPLDDAGVDVMATAIIRQLCTDYWHDCIPGQYPKGKMTDKQYEEHVRKKELERKRRRREEEKCFNGAWFRHLLKDESITGEMMMQQIKVLRRSGKRIAYADVADDYVEAS